MSEILSKSMNCPQLVRKGSALWYIPTPPPSSPQAVIEPGENLDETGS